MAINTSVLYRAGSKRFRVPPGFLLNVLGVDQIESHVIPESAVGTAETLRLMASLVRRDRADVQLRLKGLEIVDGCPGHGFDCEIDSVFRFVRDGIVYRHDPWKVEWVQDAKRTIYVFGAGDCDCKCVCLATLLACLGHPVRFKVLGLRAHSYRHVYVEVETRRGWIPLDPTPERAPAGWEARGQAAVYEIFPEERPFSPACLLGLVLIGWGLWNLAK